MLRLDRARWIQRQRFRRHCLQSIPIPPSSKSVSICFIHPDDRQSIIVWQPQLQRQTFVPSPNLSSSIFTMNQLFGLLSWVASSIAPSSQRQPCSMADKTLRVALVLLSNKTPARRNLLVPLTIIGLGIVPIVFQFSSFTIFIGRLKDSISIRQRISATFFPSLASDMRTVHHHSPDIETSPQQTSVSESDVTNGTLTNSLAPSTSTSQDSSATNVLLSPAEHQGYRTAWENEMLAHWLTAWMTDTFEGFYISSSEPYVHLAAKINNALRADKLDPPMPVVFASTYYVKKIRELAYGPEFRDVKEMHAVPREWGPEADCNCTAEMMFKWWLVALYLGQMWWEGEGYSLEMMLSWTALPLELLEHTVFCALESFKATDLEFSLELSDEQQWAKHFTKMESHLLDICGWDNLGSNAPKDWDMYNIVHTLLLEVRFLQLPSESRPWVCDYFCESPLLISPCPSSGSLSCQPALCTIADPVEQSDTDTVSCPSRSPPAPAPLPSSSYYYAREKLPEPEPEKQKGFLLHDCSSGVEDEQEVRVKDEAGLAGLSEDDACAEQGQVCPRLSRTHRQIGHARKSRGKNMAIFKTHTQAPSRNSDGDEDGDDYDGDDEFEGLSKKNCRFFL
ncbi:hypothetical protein D9758_004414 [Tetrapyrgos nigripes]|uniref:Uncharacterized protein n=1 Tax=Tetrapyrgos nigripes TaxID=182062 RepID=A0A8H5LSM0_9AGAR|nr:hypothetical protein D9758_004414 [Tetrapyrgos nigripes]